MLLQDQMGVYLCQLDPTHTRVLTWLRCIVPALQNAQLQRRIERKLQTKGEGHCLLREAFQHDQHANHLTHDAIATSWHSLCTYLVLLSFAAYRSHRHSA